MKRIAILMLLCSAAFGQTKPTIVDSVAHIGSQPVLVTYPPGTPVNFINLNSGTGTGIRILNGLNPTTQYLALDTTYGGAASWLSATATHTLRMNLSNILRSLVVDTTQTTFNVSRTGTSYTIGLPVSRIGMLDRANTWTGQQTMARLNADSVYGAGQNSLGRGATRFVAASDAAGQSKRSADWLCMGTADDTTIQHAIDSVYAIGGGTVYLSEGTFYVAHPIILRSYVSIIGTGWKTRLQLAANCNMFQSDTTADAVWLTLADMNLFGADSTGNAINITAGYLHGDWYYDRLLINHFKGDGIYIESGWHHHIFNSIIEAVGGYCIHARPLGTDPINNIRRFYVLNSGIMWNNLYPGLGNDAIYFEGSATGKLSDVSISNCKIGNSDIQQNAIHLKSVDGFTVSGNRIGGASQEADTTYDAIRVEDDTVFASQSGTIAGNTFDEGDTSAFGVERYAIRILGLSKNIVIGSNQYSQVFFTYPYIATTATNVQLLVQRNATSTALPDFSSNKTKIAGGSNTTPIGFYVGNTSATGINGSLKAAIDSLGVFLMGGLSTHTTPFSGFEAQTPAVAEIGSPNSTSTNSSYSALNLSANQSGTSHLIGAVMFTNRNISAADKRIAYVVALTSGATNTGQLSTYIMDAGTLGLTQILTPHNVTFGPTAKSTIGADTMYVGPINSGLGTFNSGVKIGTNGAKIDSAKVDSSALEFAVATGHQYRALETCYGGMDEDSLTGYTITLTNTSQWYTIPYFGTKNIFKNATSTDSSITVGIAGVYEISWSTSTSPSTSNEICHVSIFKNDVQLGKAEYETKMVNTGDVQPGAKTSGGFNLAAGDIIKVKISRETSSGDVIIKHAGLFVNRID